MAALVVAWGWFGGLLFLVGGILLTISQNTREQRLGAKLVLSGAFFPLALVFWMFYVLYLAFKQLFGKEA